MKKTIIIFLVLLINSFLTFAQDTLLKKTILKGIVTLQNSKGQPVQGVQIDATGATPTISNSFGRFELKVQGKEPGESVTVKALKIGMEVVNRNELEHFVLRKDSDNLLIIVLSPEGKRDEYAAHYYGIVLKIHNDQINEIKEEIKKLPANSDRVKELQNRIAEFQQEWYDSQQLIKELTEKFAVINLDDTDSLYFAAFEHFRSGNIEAAHNTLNPEILKKNVSDAKQKLQKIEHLKKELEQRKREAHRNLEKTIEAYKLKADIFVTQLKWEDAEYFYEQAVLADTTSYHNVFDFAYYLEKQNRHNKAILWFETALKITNSDYQHSRVLNNLGASYSAKNDYNSADDVYKRALKIREHLAATNPQTYESDVAMTLNNLANLYYNKNDYPAAENAYKRALEIYERLAVTNPQPYKPYVATTLNNLGVLYYAINDYPAAENAYKRALEIRERLVASNPQLYEHDLAITLNNLANLYKTKNDYPAAENAYKRALEIRECLAEANPQTYEPHLALSLNNLGVLYYDKNDYPAAEDTYKRALEIYERLAATNPQTYEPHLAMTLNNFGVLYYAKNDYPAAGNAYKRALEIYERLAVTNPQSYEPDVALTLNNLANLYSDKNDYPAAEGAYKRALEIYERLAVNKPQTYEPYVAVTLNNLGMLYSTKNDYPAAEDDYKRALEIYERLAETNPQTYEPHLAMTLNNLANLYYSKNDYLAADDAYKRSLEIRERLAATNPQTYEPHLAMTLNNLGYLYKAWFEATADMSYRKKGLNYILQSEKVLRTCPDIPVVHKINRQVEDLLEYFITVKQD